MNYEDLKTLDELRKSGAISEEEYEKEKQKFFEQERNSQSKNSSQLFGMSENSYIALMHISQFAGVIIPGLGLIAPIILWVMNKENNVNVNIVGKNILNFMISMLIYIIVSSILIIVLIGIPMLVALGIMYVVFVIIATIKANSGVTWKYPLTISFLK